MQRDSVIVLNCRFTYSWEFHTCIQWSISYPPYFSLPASSYIPNIAVYLITLWTLWLWTGKTCFLLWCGSALAGYLIMRLQTAKPCSLLWCCSALANTFNPRAFCKQELNKVNNRSRVEASRQLTGSEHKKIQERKRKVFELKGIWDNMEKEEHFLSRMLVE